MARKNATVQITATHEGNLGVKVLGVGEFLFERAKASLECRHYAELKGWKSTLEDAAAIPCDTETGKSASAQDKFDAIKALAEHYMTGVTVWGRKATGSAPRDETGLTLIAVMRVKGWGTDTLERKIAKMMEINSIDRAAVVKALGKNQDVIRMVGTIKAERAAASKVDAIDMLNEMDGLDDEDDGTSDEETPEEA